MIDKIHLKTSEIITDVLNLQTSVEEGAIYDPRNYFSTIYHLISGVLGVVAHNHFHAKTTTLAAVFGQLESRLSKVCVFVVNFKNSTILEQEALERFNDWFLVHTCDKIDLSDLYERLLSLEFTIENDALVSSAEKDALNSIGSFYTPTSLADKIVALTLDNYINQKTGIERSSISEKTSEQTQSVTDLFLNSTFADHSCGTGSFLLAILRYGKKHLAASTETLRKMVLNFHAIEADSLSLEIAKLQVLEAIGDLSLYSELSKKFIHGNPLIAPSNEYPEFDFCHEFYYHNALALRQDQIAKCDVIIGNPPWGTVDFDLSYYFYLLCPKLNDIEEETELEFALENLKETHPELHEWFHEHDEAVDLAMEEIYNDNRFEHSTMGGLHTNVLFTELFNRSCAENGTVGLVLKGSTLSDPINKRLVNHLSERKRIIARYDFSNTDRIFTIDKNETFSILILGEGGSREAIHQSGLTRLSEIP